MDSDSTVWQSTPPTLNATVAWQPAPPYRSTSNILISCLSTLFICVWSALHVDIATGRSTWSRYQSKLGWVFVGVFCPELLFWIAFNQFTVALLLTIKAREYLPVADDVKGGEGAQRPKLPRSYRVLKKVLGLTDKNLRTGWPDDAVSSGNWDRREDTSTVSSRGSDPGESKSEAVSPPIPPSSHVPESTPLLAPPSEASIGANIPVGRQHCWTLAHGFYAAMGGFVLQDPYVTRLSHRYLPAWQVNGVLTPAGVLALMRLEPSSIPDLAYEDIVSFGKADAIAKVLLILQVSWFLITCILRHAQDLPLCLLEITTIAHATCTLLTYFLWWAKPKDVEHQTVIVGQDARPLGAWMSMASCAGRFLLGGFLPLSFDSEMYDNPSKGFTDKDGHVSFQCQDSPASSLKMKFIFGETTVPWYWDQALEQSPTEKNANQERWTLAYRAMEKYPDSLPAKLRCARYVTPTATLQAYTTSSDYAVTDSPLTHFFAATLLMGAVYGLPHLIGFTVTFASATERTLWLVATVLVAAMGFGLLFAFTLVAFLSALSDVLVACFTGNDPELFDRFSDHMFSSCCVLSAFLYICSSGFLVGESIRQLFALPPAAFDLPSWGRYWPHFS